MTESEIFEGILAAGKEASDPEGVVVAGLVRDGKLLWARPSAGDGVRHAEDLIIEEAGERRVDLRGVELWVTLKPCSYRNPANGVDDCTSLILRAGIGEVVWAGDDPEFGTETEKRLTEAGVEWRQTEDEEIIRRAIQLFNDTVEDEKDYLGRERRKRE